MRNWIHSNAEPFTGLVMEGKVITVERYLSEFLHNQDVVVPSALSKELKLPKLHTPPY